MLEPLLDVQTIDFAQPRKAPEIEERQRGLVAKWGEVDFDDFKILLTALHFDHWDELAESIRLGALALPELTVTYPEPIDILPLELRSHGLRPEETWPIRTADATRGEAWPIRTADATRREDTPWTQFDTAVIRDKKYNTALSAVNTLLELENFTSDRKTLLFLGIPLYARLDSSRFSASCVDIDTRFDEKFQGLCGK